MTNTITKKECFIVTGKRLTELVRIDFYNDGTVDARTQDLILPNDVIPYSWERQVITAEYTDAEMDAYLETIGY